VAAKALVGQDRPDVTIEVDLAGERGCRVPPGGAGEESQASHKLRAGNDSASTNRRRPCQLSNNSVVDHEDLCRWQPPERSLPSLRYLGHPPLAPDNHANFDGKG